MTLTASVMPMPGGAVGMYKMAPSFKGGMNSLPSMKKTGTVAAISTRATAMTMNRPRTAARTTGAYSATSQRLTGLRSSRNALPRINSAARAGVSVTARRAAKPIE